MSKQNKPVTEKNQFAIDCDIEHEIVSIEDVFGIECNGPDGNPTQVIRYKEPNPFTPNTDDMNFVLRKEQLKSILLGLFPGLGINVRFVGDKGCGKSAGLAYVLGKLNWGLISVDCHEAVEMPDLTGFWINRKDGMHRIDGPLVQFFRQANYPLAFCFEEMDALPASTLVGCNQALQTGQVTLYDSEEGVEVVSNIHNKPIFSTGNTVGGMDEGAVYSGVQRQNMASLSRWVIHTLDYLSVEEEIDLINVETKGGLPGELARVLAEFAQGTRIAYRNAGAGQIRNPLSTRELITAAKLTMMFESLERAIKMAYFDKLDLHRDKEAVNNIYNRLVGGGDLFSVNEAKAA